MVFITAPSMTTPLVEYFHNATRSLRASAPIVVLRILPLLALDALLKPDAQRRGWLVSQPQPREPVIVVRSRGLPALETPCS